MNEKVLGIRSAGILLHPTSLPSPFGIGDLGPEAYRFVDFLVESDQRFWQVLPLGPTGYGDSPYLCFSAMAGNPLLISPEILRDDGLLTAADLMHLPEFPLEINYGGVIDSKIPLLKKACDSFIEKYKASTEQPTEFTSFCEREAHWLEDYALFMALKQAHGQTTWISWPSAISRRWPDDLEHWRQSLAGEIFTHKFIQYEFYRQWLRLKAYANHRGVQIIGDLPIYVAHDSAEVWAHPEHFCLEEATGEPALMAGVPPDYFSAQGQLWGNPIYEWGRLQNDRFGWWIQRFQTLLECVDIIRIDHFRGFQAYWIVKQGETTAMNGEWVEAPGEAFFETLRDALGQLPIIAEDLGVITPEVEALRDKFEFPGMKILQFAFGSGPKNPYLPFNHARNCVVYTATHDNNTTLGWFEQLSAVEKKQVTEYLGCHGAWGIHWDLIRLAFGSVANLAIIPLQDVLGLGGGARMNFPSKKAGNWRWRYAPDSLTDEIRHRLKSVTVRYGRTRVVT